MRNRYASAAAFRTALEQLLRSRAQQSGILLQRLRKVHAYTRRYGDEPSSRARDLFDMLVIAGQIVLPDGATVTAAARETFHLRDTPWPPQLHTPPDDWASTWRTYAGAHALEWTSLDDAYTALAHFWDPVLDGAVDMASAKWRPEHWRWTTAA